MSSASSTSQTQAVFHVNSNLTIFEAAEQKTTLLDALSATTEALEINLSAIEEIDSAGIQILLFIKQEASRQQKAVVYHQHSPSVLNAIEMLNLAVQLGDPLLLPRGEGV